MLWKAVVFAVLLALMIPYIRVQGRGASRVRSSVYRRISRTVTSRLLTSRITHNHVNNIPVNNVPVNNVPVNNVPVNIVPSHSNTRAPIGHPTQYLVKNRATTRDPLGYPTQNAVKIRATTRDPLGYPTQYTVKNRATTRAILRTTKRTLRFPTTIRSFEVTTHWTPSNVLGGGVILPGFQGGRNPSIYPGGGNLDHLTEPKRSQSSPRSDASEGSVASLVVLLTSLVLQKSMSL